MNSPLIPLSLPDRLSDSYPYLGLTFCHADSGPLEGIPASHSPARFDPKDPGSPGESSLLPNRCFLLGATESACSLLP